MGNTDQHNWPTPDEGDSNYEDTFSDFFAQLDDAVEIRGVDSDKSNYSAVSGAKYFATDTEKLYIGDGSSWNHVGSTGKKPTFESLDTGVIDVGKSELASVGNVIPIITAVGVSQQTVTTSSTEYQTNRQFSAVRINWGQVFESTQTIALAVAFRVDAGDASVRLVNASSDETIIEKENISGGGESANQFLGFTDYEPPDRSTTELIWLEYKSADGNETTIIDPLMYAGVRF